MAFAGISRRAMAFCASFLALGVGVGPVLAQDVQLRPQPRPATLDLPEGYTPVASLAPVEPLSDLIAEEAIVVEAAPVPVSFQAPTVGPETNLPLPRFVSLKTDEGNVRRGPSLSHRIDWVFLRRGMPLQVTGEYGHWRRVVDREGIGGWINYALISGHRTVIVDAEELFVRARADRTSLEVARFETGVIASVEACEVEFCLISAGGYEGWAPKDALWGVMTQEVFD